MAASYHNGTGVPVDLKESIKWYKLAAENGNALAQWKMGIHCYAGEFILEDYQEAAKWFTMAAEQGRAEAQTAIGTLHALGHGVPGDYVQAHMWFNIATANGDGEQAKKRREAVADFMTPEQIAEAQKLAKEWFEKIINSEK